MTGLGASSPSTRLRMRKVAGPDATFLSAELPEWHFHVSALVVLDSGQSDRFSFDAVRTTLERRLHLAPQFRWKLADHPLGPIVRPNWIDDADFDIDRHLVHIALPPPGDDRALGELVGRLVSNKIDRSRPLWEMWLIDGLAGGRSALLAKVHHSIIDGESGTELAQLLFDLEPDPPPDPNAPEWTPAPAPSSSELLLNSAAHAVEWPMRAAKLGWQFANQGVAYIRHTVSPSPTTHPFEAPKTPLNGRLTPSRSFATASVSLDRAKAVKSAFGVKLNDVVLAISAGALREYLTDLRQLPDEPLVAQVPVSMRRDDGAPDIGTKVAMMFVKFATDVDDPAERLRVIHEATSAAKEMRSALSAERLMNLTDTLSPGLLSAAALAWTASGLDSTLPPVFNTIVSNVPGPPFDLYLAGARIEAMYPMGPLLFGSGVNLTIVSNAERLDIGVLACPDLVPDPWDIASRFQPALDDLVAAAPAQ